MSTTTLREATCVGCGCTDSHACAGGCSWLAVNRDDGTGVCSKCPGALAGWWEQQAGASIKKNIQVKCTRCRHVHTEADRPRRPRSRRSTSELQIYDLVCPRCGCKSYYDCRPQVAWCWASGLIQIGDAMPADAPDGGGAIEIARGPKYALKAQIGVAARHGQGASRGQLLVPGVPEAETQQAKGDALAKWLDWRRKCKSRDGVVWAGMTDTGVAS